MIEHFKTELTLKNYDEHGCFYGYASVFGNLDLHKDIIEKGAFLNSLSYWNGQQKMPKMLWQHNPHKPIGVWHEIKEDRHGLFVRGQLLLDIRQGREAYALLKTGVVDGLSIGFKILKADRKNGTRHLHEIDLHEISLVTFAANPKAKVANCKGLFGPMDQILEGLKDLKGLIGQVCMA